MSKRGSVRRLLKCRECGQSASVLLQQSRSDPSKVVVKGEIPHEPPCSQFVQQQPRHLRKKAWRGQEKRANEILGARETLMSGAVNEDGDGRLFQEWRMEAKRTRGKHYTLRQDIWTKLVIGALAAGEEPVLHVEFDQGMTLMRRVLVRAEYYLASGRSLPPYDARGQSASVNTYRMTPERLGDENFVPLKPPAVDMSEAAFIALKEKIDGRSGDAPEGASGPIWRT